MKKLEPFNLTPDEREEFKNNRICCTCGTNLNVSPKQKAFQWVPKWTSFLILLSPLIYLIVFFIKVKKVKIEMPQCEECEKREKKYRNIGLLLVFGGILLVFSSLFLANSDLFEIFMPIAFLGFFVLLIVGVILLVKAAIRVDKIDENDVITFLLNDDVVNKLNGNPVLNDQ